MIITTHINYYNTNFKMFISIKIIITIQLLLLYPKSQIVTNRHEVSLKCSNRIIGKKLFKK